MPRLTDEIIWVAISERNEARAVKARALASELRLKGTIHPHDIRQIELLGDKFMTFMREVLRPAEQIPPAPGRSHSDLLLALGAFGFSSVVVSTALLGMALWGVL